MAAPTVRFRVIPQSTLATAIDTPAERIGTITDQQVVSTGEGNEVDFSTVDISGGAANSEVRTIIFDVTDDGGNTAISNFKLWLSSFGADMAGTEVKFQPLSGADQTSPSDTENYVEDAAIEDYTWATLPESEPESQNVFPSDEGSTMALSTTSDDGIMWAEYIAIAAGETTGTYRGTVANYEFQHSFKYSYS